MNHNIKYDENNIMIFTINDLTLRGTKIKHINNGCVYTTCLRPTPNVFYSLQNPSRQTIQKVFLFLSDLLELHQPSVQKDFTKDLL